jgi:hypothetical protein
MTLAQIITAAVAAYAAVVSTLSLALALKTHRAANPKVALDWIYAADDRKLVVNVYNTGRADITITNLDLYLDRHVITSRSWISSGYGIRVYEIEQIPAERWLSNPETVIMARLASHSTLSVQVKHEAISLPSQYSIHELHLRFVASFPGNADMVDRFFPFGPKEAGSTAGKAVAFLAGDVLRHFAGIDPDVPIRYPSPGSLPMED